MNYIWSVIILIFIVTTVLAITLDKSNLYKGGCVNLSLFIAMFMLYIFAIDLNNYWLTLFLLLIAAFFVAILPLSLVLLIGSLCYLGWQLMTKEGKRLTNFLSLGLASVLISLLILSIIINSIKDTFFSLTWHWISALILYFMLHIFSFATTYLYLKFKRKNAPPAYIIILGSGLINNEVPPLLQSRIKKGLNLSKKFPNATIIFSGGQGEDEELAEGLAMQIYAQNQGLDVSNSIVENKSLNTYENLKFSKSYITNLNDLCYIITNHFHTLRAAQLAKQMHLKYEVIGSPVKLYFWTNAIIREYIATLAMHKYRHATLLSVITIIYLAIGVLNYIIR